MSEPITFEVKCKYCGTLLNPVALEGLESDTVECGVCGRRITIENLEAPEGDDFENSAY